MGWPVETGAGCLPQMLFSFQAYILGPLLRQRLRMLSDAWWQLLTLGLELGAALMLAWVSRTAPAAFLAASGVCTLVSPWWLVGVQDQRVKIGGPWDIAEVPG